MIRNMMLVILLLLSFQSTSWASEDIKLDGSFADWRGRAFLSDRQGDGPYHQDLKRLYWGTLQNDNNLYFMIEQYPSVGSSASIVKYRMYLDINANSNYKDPIDKFIDIAYRPGDSSGEVTIALFTVEGKHLSDYQGKWGEKTKDGGSRLEFCIPMDHLSVHPAQSVNFYLTGYGSAFDRIPDHGDILWKPFPIVIKNKVTIAALTFLWIGITIFFYRNRIWLFYYIWGAVGFTFIVIILLRGSVIEYHLEHQAALILHQILGYFSVKTAVFDRAASTLLVLTKVDNSWAVIDIDIESSGLLEMCILLGLIIFYPPSMK